MVLYCAAITADSNHMPLDSSDRISFTAGYSHEPAEKCHCRFKPPTASNSLSLFITTRSRLRLIVIETFTVDSLGAPIILVFSSYERVVKGYNYRFESNR